VTGATTTCVVAEHGQPNVRRGHRIYTGHPRLRWRGGREERGEISHVGSPLLSHSRSGHYCRETRPAGRVKISRAGPGESVACIDGPQGGPGQPGINTDFLSGVAAAALLHLLLQQQRSDLEGGRSEGGEERGWGRQMRIRRQGERDTATNKDTIEKMVSLKHEL
jgi:hypothetical protein